MIDFNRHNIEYNVSPTRNIAIYVNYSKALINKCTPLNYNNALINKCTHNLENRFLARKQKGI